jgi:hypothetical protein
MSSIIELTPVLFAITLTGLLSACDRNSQTQSAATLSPRSAPGAGVANDCRSPQAQSTQRGCRPVTKVMGSL